MSVVATSVPAMLGEQARQRPNALAYTFVDYEVHPLGFAESLTAELKKRGGSEEEALRRLQAVKRTVASAISISHSLRVTDLVLVPPGSIPITTSGKIRRSECAERYRNDEFTRLGIT
jgi:hypothetical protein